MRIGFDAKRAFNNHAGLGNFSRNSICALTRQYPREEYFLFHPQNKKPLFVAPLNSTEIKPERFWWKKLNNTWRTFQITKLANGLNLDIYHGLSHELPVGIERTGIKSVVTIHDLIYIRYSEFFKLIDRNIYDLKFRHACRIATRIHAISEQTKQDLMSFYSIAPEKIDVVYQSVNPIFYERCNDQIKQQVRQKNRLPEQFILTVGTVEPRKNLRILLEGMISANIKMPLVVVGKPTRYQKKVEKFIQAHADELQVVFLSGIKDAELAAIYQLANVLVYPSIFEGFGLPVAEAQASGCPVITSNTSSLPEVGGDAAVYVDPSKPKEIGQALAELLVDEDLRKQLIEKGTVNAQRFTPENYATQLMQLYKNILND